MEKSSRISGFYKLGVDERLAKVAKFASLTDEEVAAIKNGTSIENADRMIENVVARLQIPIGVATNFQVNGRDYLVPMATEEASVVAAASNAAKIVRDAGGFIAEASEPIMIGQIQLVAGDAEGAERIILENKEQIIELANEKDPTLVSLGGGVKDLKTRILDSDNHKMVIVHLHVNVQDAMGANAVNTMAEAVSPYIEKITKGKVYLRILSNLATERIAKAKCVIPKEVIGEEAIDGIINAYEFAAKDPYRASTHNKGVMNGITAVTLATGNDTRAVEAGAHSFAALDGYKPLTRWSKNDAGDLLGEIELPLAVGTFGGATMNPVSRAMFKILRVSKAKELSCVMAAVGLAQNLAALKALSTEGIQRGHMALHAKNIAMMAGSSEQEVAAVAEKMIAEKNIRVDRAKEILAELRS